MKKQQTQTHFSGIYATECTNHALLTNENKVIEKKSKNKKWVNKNWQIETIEQRVEQKEKTLLLQTNDKQN